MIFFVHLSGQVDLFLSLLSYKLQEEIFPEGLEITLVGSG